MKDIPTGNTARVERTPNVMTPRHEKPSESAKCLPLHVAETEGFSINVTGTPDIGQPESSSMRALATTALGTVIVGRGTPDAQQTVMRDAQWIILSGGTQLIGSCRPSPAHH